MVMVQQVPFIDREDELASIEAAIEDWGARRVLCISGPGGIGKTRLMQEVRRRYSAPAPAVATTEKKQATVAIVHEFTASEWSEQFIAGTRDMAAELGVALLETDAGFDLDKMAAELEEVIQQSPDVIVIRLGSSEKLRPGIERAIAQGVKVLVFDNYLQRLDGLTARVALDDYEGTQLSLELLAKDINFQGKVAAVWTEGAVVQEKRKRILDSVLMKYPDIELVAQYGVMGEDMADEIYRETKRVLVEHPDLRAIWVTWDEFTRGVVRALTEEERTDVSVYSFDSCISDIETMLQPDNPLAATVTANPEEIGRIIVRLATLAAYGAGIDRHVSLPRLLITRGSLLGAVVNGRLDKDSHPLWDESDIAWTPWLESLQSGSLEEMRSLVVTDILDFDNLALHSPQNLGRRIAEMLGEEAFEPYLQALLDLRKMEAGGVSLDRLTKEQRAVDQVFVDCFNKLASRQRVVLALDTTEKLEGTSIWEYILGLAVRLKNVVMLVAGREARSVWETLRPTLGSDVGRIELPPFEPEASETYIQQKQELLHITLEPDLVQKLLLLAGGRPILIDLAVEWRAREIPLEWLVSKSLEELESLSDEEMDERRHEFEQQLVDHIAETRRPIDWLILKMSRVYPLDVDMIVELLKLRREDAESLFDDAQTYAFVKSLPDGSICLHDEMRRMVVDYVWPKVDPESDRRREDSRSAATYFEREIAGLRAQIAEFEAAAAATGGEPDSRAQLRAFMERESLERELRALQQQWLYHTLLVEPSDGVDVFAAIFDEATKAYRFAFRGAVIEEVQKVLDQLTGDQLYKVNIRRAKYLLDQGQYEEGKALLERMERGEGLEPAQRVDMHIQSGNLEVRLGDLGAGRAHFEEAVRISREHGLGEWLTRSLNALGWGHRLMGHFAIALQHYEEALELSVTLDDRQREAWVLNNMAYALAHLGNYSTALNLCEQALELWHEIDFDRGLGALHEVYGEIYVLSERFDRAIDHYRDALDIFEPSDDREWLSRVYAGYGLAYRLSGDLDSAERILNQALEIGLEKDKALILHRLAHVHLERGQVDEAERLYRESYALCDTSLEADLQLNNLSDLAAIAVRKGQYERLGEFDAKFSDYKRRWPDVNFPRAEGTLLKNLGDMALSAAPDDVESAWGYYGQAFPLLALYGDLRPYSAQVQLGELNNLLITRRVPAETVKQLGARLSALWQQEGLVGEHPDALRFFWRWKEGQYYG
jgi:ABC-type sugar transport system substrate-binding protein/tetratricopeptide (TPR) repeat protein